MVCGPQTANERGVFRSPAHPQYHKQTRQSSPAISSQSCASSRNSLGNVFGLPARAGVGALLSLVVRVDQNATSGVLESLLCAAHHDFLGALGLLDLRCLVSDLTITGHRSVLLSHVLNF